MALTLKRKLARAAGLAAAKRVAKMIPLVGTVFVVGMAGNELRRKGVVAGATSVTLDLLPFVGTAKNVIELFTGDLIPDKTQSQT